MSQQNNKLQAPVLNNLIYSRHPFSEKSINSCEKLKNSSKHQKGTEIAQNQDQLHFATKVQKYSHLEKTVCNENGTMFINYPQSKQENCN